MKPAMKIVAVIVAVVLVYYLLIKPASVEGMGSYPFAVSPGVGAQVDSGMYDAANEDAFGTTDEANRRVTNYGVRAEYHKNPMPLGFGCGDCDKNGVPDPALGHTHVCKAGLPSKRMIDAYGGSHFMLPHMCNNSSGKCDEEPPQLGRFWCRKGCSSPESVGLDIRPACTRCGN